MSYVFDLIWYNFWFGLTFIGMVFGFSFRRTGAHNIPRKGAFLIIANHQSFFDPHAVSSACLPRRVHFIARRTLYKPAWFGWLLSSLHTYPIDQEGSAKGGLMTALRLLREGKTVVLFPEGTRTEDGSLGELKPGLLLILRKYPVPVVPVGVVGAFEAMPYWEKVPKLSPLFFPPEKSAIAAAVGKPIDGRRLAEMPREEALAELTNVLKSLMDQARRIKRKV